MRETLTKRKESRKPSLLEDIKPFTALKGLDTLTQSRDKLPLLRSPSPSSQGFFPNFNPKHTTKNSLENTKPEDQASTPRRTPKRHPTITAQANIVRKVAFKTRVGSVKSKPKLHNQDTYIIKPSLFSTRGHYLFSVCDGHGAYGHYVSQYIHDSFPTLLEECVERDLTAYSVEKAIYRAISKLCKGLQETGIELSFSGSTMITVLLLGSLCICSNVGDSRAVLGRCTLGCWEAVALSHDHNTLRLDERTRILNSHGRISKSKDDNGNLVGPERVWLPDDDIPGLAMTRSIGDKISKAVGVTSDPEVITRRLSAEDKFIVLASDGIWEYISNEDAVNIVQRYWNDGEVEEAAHAIVSEAHKKWKKSEYVDDITVIVVFLAVNET